MKKKKIQYSNIIAILFIIASIYLINAVLLFDKIETFLRYLGIFIIVVIDLYLLFRLFFGKKKKKRKLIYSILLVIFSLLFVYVGSHLNKIYSYFSDMDKNIVYSTSLVTLKEKYIQPVNKNGDVVLKISNKKIGVSTDGDQKNLSQVIIDKHSLSKDNEIINFESNAEMILQLYEGKLDYIFLPTNYVDIYSSQEGFENIGEKIVVVITEQTEATKEEVQLSGSSKDVSEPFTMLLVGIDSTVDGLQNADSFNGDSLIVVTFNPNTFTATMLSIPRDSYVPISCMNNVDNKITHAAGQGGTNCVIKTVQNFLDVKIDYYMKINFTGVVELVDAVGGIEVDVPNNICEQNSKRQFGEHTVYIRQGHQTLDGEQALAYARNRKDNSQYCSKDWTQGERSDFVRAAHQQEVIQAILEKMKDLSSINDLENILKVVSKNLDTNMEQSTMFSFYNVFKDVLVSSSSDKVVTIQKLYLDGTGQMIYDERSKLVLWDYILNQNSLSAVKKAMKDNLSGTKQELIKEFSYGLNENYKVKVIGEGYSGTVRYDLLISLEGKTLSEAQSWASSHGLTLSVEYVKSSGSRDNTVIEQEYPVSKRIDLIPNKTMKVKVVNNSSSTTTTKVDCLKETGNSACKLPSLIGKTEDDFKAWGNGFSNMLKSKTDKEESNEKVGTIIKIVDDDGKKIEAGTTVKTLLDKGTTVHVIIAKAKSSSSSGNSNSEGGNSEGSGNTNTDSGNTNSTDNGNSGSGNTDNGSSGGNNSSGGDNNENNNSGGNNTSGGDNNNNSSGGENQNTDQNTNEESNNP